MEDTPWDIDPDTLNEEDYELLERYLQGEYSPELAELLESYHRDNQMEYERIPFLDLYTECMIPTATQAFTHVIPLFILCLLFKILCAVFTSVNRENVSPTQFLNLSSSLCGIIILWRFFDSGIIYLLVCCTATYIIIKITLSYYQEFVGIFVSIFIVTYILVCELILVDSKVWHSMRGAQMILSMKLISVSFDLSSNQISYLPGLLEFYGYCLHVGSVIFGPWFSFQDYITVIQQPLPLSFRWILKVLFSCILAVMCLIFSTCLSSWIIIQGSYMWILAYRDAQSFRFSHYFVCFLSEASHVLSGFGSTKFIDDIQWNYHVAKPHRIELPHSLVEVVTNWNLPMHHWLKTYVFKTARPLGNFTAVLLTYGASSLLHGLNFQLASVLLSLGFYSYIEFGLRQKLASSFDACILAKRCKEKCDHKYKNRNPFVIWTNMFFMFLSVFHLAYLGLMFDNSSEEETGYTMSHTLNKWSELSYASHWVAFGTFLFNIVI
ncbi:hypothetical protein LOTGIDRAFT_234449 [Lottia gigantea]|uniref:Protein-serine O-palmitoleoyltransferase porcupine n=1 Tax=Lottia gigantea TaxID=225164 RepID=V4A1W8_LOTGI|nr:hypothetical protein LOTGIDRAFT_234449 [Lottia gigantea]ESO88895.1 hypothetical protein LOTGIDRAFT_234449 [Lottia gigantea]